MPRLSRVFILATLALAATACRPEPEISGGDPAAVSAATSATSDAANAGTPAAAATTNAAGGDVGVAGDTSGVLARADASRIQGALKATTWLVVVSDFQCPYCKTWHDETYPTLVSEYVKTGKIRMAYVHLPLKMHPHAVPAAEASLCAGLQGKFWEMQDAIFRTQDTWSKQQAGPRVFDALASQVGVGIPAYQQCMASGATRPLVQADYDRVTRAGVRSTPTFLIGNETLAGAQPIAAFRDALDRAIARAAAGGKPSGS